MTQKPGPGASKNSWAPIYPKPGEVLPKEGGGVARPAGEFESARNRSGKTLDEPGVFEG